MMNHLRGKLDLYIDIFKDYFLKSNGRIILIHLVLWILFTLYEGVFLYYVGNQRVSSFYHLFPSYACYALFFYTNALYLLPHFFEKKRYFSYLFGLIIIMLFVVVFKYSLRFYILPFFKIRQNWQTSGEVPPANLYQIAPFLALMIQYIGNYLIYSFGYWYALRAIRLEKEKKRLQQEILKTQLDYLRFQINPHFLYNALNFFYGQVLTFSKPLANGIMQLTDMMRYAVAEDEGDHRVELTNEVKNVRNYINMQQLRFDNKCQVNFELTGSLLGKRIMPLILTTFIENVFKHAELYDPNEPAIIKMELFQNQFTLSVHNKNKIGLKEPSTGMGVVNSVKRLKLFYKERVTFQENQDKNYYSCRLKILL
jgi:two-component system, LytTR family, sensor kinase